MPLLVTSVPNLVQGISQQPDNLRYPGQSDEQVNAWSTIVEGLVKRPNTDFVKDILPTDDADLFTHFVKRDENNKYVVTVAEYDVLGASTVEVKATNVETGADIPISPTTTATNYLSGITNPKQELKALTVADYTFLVNKSKKVKINEDADTKTKDLEYEALVVVKLGDYQKAYSIYLDGKLIPPDTALANHHEYTSVTNAQASTYISGPSTGTHAGTQADTEFIARDLKQCLDAYLTSDGIVSGVTFSLGTGSGFSPTKTMSGNNTVEYSYEFFLDQFTDATYTTRVGTGAKGTMVFDASGQLQSYQLTQSGTGYDGTQTTPGTYDNPLFLTIREHKTVSGRVGKNWGRQVISSDTTDIINTTPGYGFPTIDLDADVTLPSTSNFNVEREGSVIKITGDTDFTLRVEDGLANQGLGVIYKEVQSITDLPTRCYDEFRVKVIGDADIDQDDYYVKFITKDRTDFGEGSWIECGGWESGVESARLLTGINTTLDYETMPVTLVPCFNNGSITKFLLQLPNEDANIVEHKGTYYNLIKNHTSSNNTEPGTGGDWTSYWNVVTSVDSCTSWETDYKYLIRDIGWTARVAGDDNTNPFPSFTGNTINDVFFFKNRLGFLTDSNVVFSEADNYFNFFRTTTQQLLDSAPIDVGLSHTKVAVLQHALPFQEKLMLFSRQSQFVLRGADILSPKTVSISPVTEYDISDNIEPVALGNFIYFPFKRDAYEGVYEYFVDNNTEVFEATEITAQVPKLIPSDVSHMIGTASENMIVCKSSADARTLYVYKYYWQNKEKIQSAWMKFTYNYDIRGFDFIDSELYLIMSDGGDLRLERAIMENGVTDTGLDYRLLLDSRVDSAETTLYNLSVTYDAPSKTTTISNFPYDPTDVVIYTKGGTYKEFTRTSATAGTVSGDLSSTPFFAGLSYNMLYRFSNQILKQPTERGGRSASDYTFQTIRNASIEYADTGHFTVEVTPRFRDTYSYPYNPALLASLSTLDSFTPESGHFRFAVQAQPNEATIEVKSDSALPCKLLAAEFESMIIPRAKRYGS